MHQSVVESVFLNRCKKLFATTKNSVENVEKPYRKWADFLKVEKFDLIEKPFQGPTALMHQFVAENVYLDRCKKVVCHS